MWGLAEETPFGACCFIFNTMNHHSMNLQFPPPTLEVDSTLFICRIHQRQEGNTQTVSHPSSPNSLFQIWKVTSHVCLSRLQSYSVASSFFPQCQPQKKWGFRKNNSTGFEELFSIMPQVCGLDPFLHLSVVCWGGGGYLKTRAACSWGQTPLFILCGTPPPYTKATFLTTPPSPPALGKNTTNDCGAPPLLLTWQCFWPDVGQEVAGNSHHHS